MKRLLHCFLLLTGSTLSVLSADAQADTIYWREGFDGGTISTVSPTSGGPVGYYAEGANSPGAWYVKGVYRTTGTSCPAPHTAYHLRFRNGGVALPDSPHVVTPVVNYGIKSIHLTHTRADKNITIWWTPDTLATTTNWNLVGVFDRYQPTCTDLYMPVNQATARRLKIEGRQSTDSDEDSIWLTSTSVLPVTFSAINALYTNGSVKVNWETATEINLAGYLVERSYNGRDFSSIANVPVKENGTAGSKNYSWMDNNPLNGVGYYRVRALDKDGQYTLTSIVKVNTSNSKLEIAVAPNPVRNGMMNIQMSSLTKGNYSLRVFNVAGQVVFTAQVSTEGGSLSQSFRLPATVRTGVYTLQVTGNDINVNKKIVIE